MVNIMGGFSGFESWGVIGKYIGIGFLFLLGMAIFMGVFFFLLIQLRKKEVHVLNLENHRATKTAAREMRGTEQGLKLYIEKLKRYVPAPDQGSLYTRGKKDTIYYMVDSNGLLHSLKLPNELELKKYYKAVYDLDLDEVKKELDKKEEEGKTESDLLVAVDRVPVLNKSLLAKAAFIVGTIFWLPNPAESLSWLVQQHTEADKHFPAVWYKNPVFLIMGTLVICAFVFVITLLISKKM